MSVYLRKHMRRLIAGTLAVSSVAMVNAAALNKAYGVLSSNVKSSVGNVLTSADIENAELAVMQNKELNRAALRAELEEKEKQKADEDAAFQAKLDAKFAEIEAAGAVAGDQYRAEAKIRNAAAAKARDDADAKATAAGQKKIAAAEATAAKARDDAEAKTIAAQQATGQPADHLGFSIHYSSSSGSPSSTSSPSTGSSYTPIIDRLRSVSYSSSYNDHGSGTLLGNFKLTFYCPCEICNGRTDAKTASGTTMAEGRTIAVDKSVIPLGSRVYIDGFGEFIAEDTGSAIVENRIDICVYSHERAYELGVQYGDVYLLS